MPEFLLATVRFVHLTALLSLFGTLVFWLAVAPAALALMPRRMALEARFRRIAFASLATAILSAPVWLLFQTIAFNGGTTGLATTIPKALLQTQFGIAWLARLASMVVAGACLFVGGRLAIILATVAAGVAVVLQLAVGHVAALEGDERTFMMLVQAIHVIAAGAWLGGLAPLWLTVGLPYASAAAAARRFSALGLMCVAALAITAVINAWQFAGSIPALLGTPYGLWLLLKAALFLAMICLAAANRYRITPALRGVAPALAARRLRISIAAETALGGAVVFAASMLSATTPGTHSQPWWPLSFRFSGEILGVPELRHEILIAAGMTAAGLALFAASVRWRRMRGPLLVLGMVLVGYFSPTVRLLSVEAFPTTFWRSPTGFSAESIVRGAALFAEHCAACHGARGAGDGPAAAALAVKPADLTADHLYDHSDGDLFWWISTGIGNGAMPGFADALDETARWNLIDFVHANAASVRIANGAWTRPVPAPGFTARCPDDRYLSLEEMRGHVVHLIVGGSPATAGQASPQSTITVFAGTVQGPAPQSACVVDPSAVTSAYAVASGTPSIAAGTQAKFLIDAAGWLRERWLPGDQPDWQEVAVLRQRVAHIAAQPLAAPPKHVHVH